MATEAECSKEHRNFADRQAAKLMTEAAVEGAKAVLTLDVLQFVSRDIWGSADLHFDGDCFQEHEWHVIMRGGTFGSISRMHASGKTALEAVLAAAHVKLKASTWLKGKERRRYWGQVDIWQQMANAYEARLPVVRQLDQKKMSDELKNADFGGGKKPLTKSKK